MDLASSSSCRGPRCKGSPVRRQLLQLPQAWALSVPHASTIMWRTRKMVVVRFSTWISCHISESGPRFHCLKFLIFIFYFFFYFTPLFHFKLLSNAIFFPFYPNLLLNTIFLLIFFCLFFYHFDPNLFPNAIFLLLFYFLAFNKFIWCNPRVHFFFHLLESNS